MLSKQLALSADNLLSLQLDTCLTLSSSVPSGRFAASLPVSRTPAAAADVHAANCKPVRRKRRRLRVCVRPVGCESPSTKPTSAVPDVDSRLRFAASGMVSGHNCNPEALRSKSVDVSCDQTLQSGAVDVDDYVCSTRVSRQRSQLPRSGSNITRKKAFYKIERPLSIVRRDSSLSTSDECLNTS